MKPSEKRQILATFVEQQVHQGIDITDFFGKPLSLFDYDKLKRLIEKRKIEIEKENNS